MRLIGPAGGPPLRRPSRRGTRKAPGASCPPPPSACWAPNGGRSGPRVPSRASRSHALLPRPSTSARHSTTASCCAWPGVLSSCSASLRT
eukprot:1140848-Lingulodinium_polyedra.AAC.1